VDGVDQRGEAMAEEFWPLARSLAWRCFQRTPLADLDELVSVAYDGLVQACARHSAYCAERGFDPDSTDYRAAFVSRRINGALLDFMRASDHLSRNDRNAVKMLTEAEAMGLDRDGQLRYAGLDQAAADRVRAADAARPVSLSGSPPSGTDPDAGESGAFDTLADEADVESSAVVGSVIGAALRVIRELDEAAQWLMVLTAYYGLEVGQAAEVLGLAEDKAREVRETAITRVHQAMIMAAT
jgi:DNA-directed RNA polymerase specialized sigma subunit